MANLPWTDEVRARLAKHALPPTYINRFLNELTDHLEDIKEQNMSMDANVCSRLGQPEQVANAAITAYRQRSFISRHPTATFLVFAVSPIIAIVLLFIIASIGVGSFGVGIAWLGLSWDDVGTSLGIVGLAIARYLIMFLTIVIPSILLSILYCKLAARLGLGKKWMFIACIALGLIASLCFHNVKYTGIAGQNQWIIGIGFPPELPQLIHLVFPLAIGWWFVHRKHDQGQFQSA